jgi:rubrerythrin
MDRKMIYLAAIGAEIRSQKLYHSLAISFRRPETSAVFQQLVVLEKTHEEKVRAAFQAEFSDSEVPEMPVIDPDLAGIDLKDPKQILEFAMGREDIARGHYLSLAADTRDEEMRKLLLELADEESQHKELLLAEIQHLQGAMQWFDPSELSGLMEH